MSTSRISCVVMSLILVLGLSSCTKPPSALAVELLFDEVPALQDQGYTYVRAEPLAGGFVVVVQQSELAATVDSTPVFWVGEGRAHLVNEKAKAMVPDLAVAPTVVFGLLDPALFPDFLQNAFKDMLVPAETEAATDAEVSIDTAARGVESP